MNNYEHIKVLPSLRKGKFFRKPQIMQKIYPKSLSAQTKTAGAKNKPGMASKKTADPKFEKAIKRFQQILRSLKKPTPVNWFTGVMLYFSHIA
ncbi:MAG: hypothetical protein A3J76_01755 [Candidatus Moranbacteria bacterium RBG_13_45_13]|nr:MAG: hypothetical protein A3J76_01755 [Candidatus Moranbacteria bacterium RBG_13_45_13]